MEEKVKKILGYVFAALVAVALVLVIVGMFVGQLGVKGGGESETVKLFDEGWGKYGAPSNTFAVISYIVTIVGLVVLLADAVLRLFAKKDLKIVRIIGVALAVVGAILVLVSGLLMVNDMWSVFGESKELLKKAGLSIYCAAGVWLAFIGGLVGGVAGGLGLLKQFN